MPASPDLAPVRARIRAAIAGPSGHPKSPLPASAWKWTTAGQLLRARLLARLSIARRVPPARWQTFAAAIELVHAASLLHDDVIDGALLRRHAPALWTLYGPRLAILAGDYLLAAAFDLMAPYRTPLATMLTAARTTCVTEMQRELAPPPPASPRRASLLDHARGKTGPLFSLAAAGLLPPSPSRTFWEQTGSELGLLYQIADDLSDADETTGKTPNRDTARHLPTTASFSTPADLRARLDALSTSLATSPIPTAAERTAFSAYLAEDFIPSLRPLSPQPPRRSPLRKARPRQ